MNNSIKYFHSRCNELLHRKTFDAYRVSLHTPISIFKELDYCIKKYNSHKIKHYKPTITAICEETLSLLELELVNETINFGTFGALHVKDILHNAVSDDKNIKTTSFIARTIISSNINFKIKLFDGIKKLLESNTDQYSKLDILSSWLLSELLREGYSRIFIKNRISKFYKSLENGDSLDIAYLKLSATLSSDAETYAIIFKLKTNDAVDLKINTSSIIILEQFPPNFFNERINKDLTEPKQHEVLISTTVESHDFQQAIKVGFHQIAEVIDINTLQKTDLTISLYEKAFAFHLGSRKSRTEPLNEYLDGFYNSDDSKYNLFVENYMLIVEKSAAREKLRSAIRFLKMGNESTELEHKFLNYWIGFEQLFSSEFSEGDSISRIKSFFTSINGAFYLQRKVNYMESSIKRLCPDIDSLSKDNFFNKEALGALVEVSADFPIINFRLSKYKDALFENKKIIPMIEQHEKRLVQHLTRLYRIRNEIVHEGASSLELELVCGHLRHYLLFSIEQITSAIANNDIIKNLDDAFVYYENIYKRIKKANSIKEIFDIQNYVGYME